MEPLQSEHFLTNGTSSLQQRWAGWGGLRGDIGEKSAAPPPSLLLRRVKMLWGEVRSPLPPVPTLLRRVRMLWWATHCLPGHKCRRQSRRYLSPNTRHHIRIPSRSRLQQHTCCPSVCTRRSRLLCLSRRQCCGHLATIDFLHCQRNAHVSMEASAQVATRSKQRVYEGCKRAGLGW